MSPSKDAKTLKHLITENITMPTKKCLFFNSDQVAFLSHKSLCKLLCQKQYHILIFFSENSAVHIIWLILHNQGDPRIIGVKKEIFSLLIMWIVFSCSWMWWLQERLFINISTEALQYPTVSSYCALTFIPFNRSYGYISTCRGDWVARSFTELLLGKVFIMRLVKIWLC